MDKRTLMLD